jgi:hypothetical protein
MVVVKCSKHMGNEGAVVQLRICVRTEDTWANEIAFEGVSQTVVKIVRN